MKRALEWEASLNYMTKVTYDIEKTDGYVPGETPVIILGSMEKSSLYKPRKGFGHIAGTGFYSPYIFTFPRTYEYFFEEILSYNINLIYDRTDLQYEEIVSSESVKRMPVYPSKGSCQMVNGILVVKLSEGTTVF